MIKVASYWKMIWVAILLLAPLDYSYSQFFGAAESNELPDIEFEVISSHTKLRPGDEGIVAVILDIPPGYHIQDDLKVEFAGADGITAGELLKPEGTKEGKWTFYYGKPHFAVPISVLADAEMGERNVNAKIQYSPCSELLCLGRFVKEVPLTLAVTDEAVQNEVFAAVAENVPEVTKAEKQEVEEQEADEGAGVLAGRIEDALERGSWVVFLLIFLGGIASSFTPCVYPMIPITVSYFGSRATGNLFKGFLMSLVYVLGIVITYSIMGVVAGATGAAFGSFAEHPIVIIITVAIFLLLAASMFGAFELQLPAGLRTKLATGSSKQGVLGPLFLGLVLGFVASPCIGPVILVILTFIAKKQSVMYGFWLMFFFASGMGVLFVVIGTFSGAINRLPKSGVWMLAVKKIFGSLMIAMAIYFVRPLLPAPAYGYVIAVALIVFGVFAGALTRICEQPTIWDNLKKIVAVVAIVIGIYGLVTNMSASGLFVPPGMRSAALVAEATGLEIDWTESFERALSKAKADDKPIMIDFYAENCPACIEMDNFTYSNPEVIEVSEGFVPAKLYANDNKDHVSRYGIFGYPATVFVRADGTQIGETEHGFIEAERFLKLMDKALKGP